MWAAQYFDFREPRLWLTSGSMGTMGFGLPAAIGAQFAHPRQARHRHRRRREHPHEHRRARNRHDLRPAGQGRRAQQLRRRHGQAVAEAVLQGPPVGERQVAAQEGLRQGGAGRRLPLRRAARSQGRTCRASIAEFLAFKGPAFLEVIIDPDAGVYPMVGPGQALRRDDHRRPHHRRATQHDVRPPDASEMF